jgi:hypothetical protein
MFWSVTWLVAVAVAAVQPGAPPVLGLLLPPQAAAARAKRE